MRLPELPGIPKRRAFSYLTILAAVYVAGVVILGVSENLSLLDAAYFTMVTLTTVGYGDITPTTWVSKAVLLILAPAGLVAVFGLGLSLVQEQVDNLLIGERRRMERKLSTIANHYIVCGHGSLGRQVVIDLLKMNQPMVVIDNRSEALEKLGDIPVVVGDALDLEVLHRAGLQRAKAVLATFDNDADNMYLVLEVKEIAPHIEVLAVASNVDAARRLSIAGAKRVISPNVVGAELLAKSAVNPGVMQLVANFTDPTKLDEEIIQLPVMEGSPLCGTSLRDFPDLGLSVKVVLIKSGDKLEISPAGDTEIPCGSLLLVAGTAAELKKAEAIAAPK